MPVKTARKKTTRTTAAGTFLPRKVGHVMIFVKNMKKSVAFYRDTLGWPCLYESAYWSEFRTEGATVALHHGDDAKPRDTGISFHVGNVDDTVKALVRRGVKIVRPAAPVSDDIRCASFADAEGNVLGVSGR